VSVSGRKPGQYGASSSANSAGFAPVSPATGVFAASFCTCVQLVIAAVVNEIAKLIAVLLET
jgi:hypothetical protein